MRILARFAASAAAITALACGTDEVQAPDPPAGVEVGRIVLTVEKDGQPSTRRSYAAPAYFDLCATSTGIVSDTLGWSIEFGIGGRFAVSTYPLTSEMPLPAGYVVAGSSFTYPWTTPPIPTTGQLSILYVSAGRIDGTFHFTGGADSAGVTWTNLVQGAFSATPIPFSQCGSSALSNRRLKLTGAFAGR